MKTFEWMAELRYRNSFLYRVGLIHFILTVLLLIPLLVDSRQVLGINAWIKPIKFCLSIGIYTWTFGWILFDIPGSSRLKKILTMVIGISMIAEIMVIIYQASRATQSHFNISNALDASLFSVMGTMIALNTIAIIITFVLFLVKKPMLDKAYLLALRLGLAVFIIGNWVGSVMISNMAHAVGVEDGGPGMAFTNWSTEGGDLRVAHFLGLHSIQIIPILSFYIKEKTGLSTAVRQGIAVVSAIVYAGFVGYLYLQAMKGIPLVD